MEFTNSRGVKWYLHKKQVQIGRNKIKTMTHFFRKEKKDDICYELPVGYKVIETHSGLPFVKKI